MLADTIAKIAAMTAEEKEEHAYYARPSIAGPDRCIRQMVYWGMNIPRAPLPGRTILVFDDSSWHEELTMDWLRKSAFQVHSEQMEAKTDFRGYPTFLTGHIDFIVTDLLGKDYLVEHKAINHFTFQKFWDGEIPQDYMAQTCIYLRGLYKDNPSLYMALLLVKNKNTAQYIEYLIEYNYEADLCTVVSITHSTGETKDLNVTIPGIVGAAFEKFAAVDAYVVTKTLPKRQYFIDDWHCDYCGWNGTCWEGYEQEFNELKTDQMLPGEFADMVRYNRELGASKGEIEKEYKELTEKIKSLMKDIDTREGRAGEYLVRLALIETERIDQNLLTPAEIARATKKSFYERLFISTPKPPKEKKAKKGAEPCQPCSDTE